MFLIINTQQKNAPICVLPFFACLLPYFCSRAFLTFFSCLVSSNATKAVHEGALEVALCILKKHPDNIMSAYLSLKIIDKLLNLVNCKWHKDS